MTKIINDFKYFDSHTHYNIEPLNENIDNMINDLIQNHVFINLIGVDLNTSIKAIEIAKKYKFICAVGIHPCDCYNLNDEDLYKLEKLIIDNQDVVKSIGECGLDYHYENTNKDKQFYFFKKQIELALKLNLNLIIHIRDAHEDAIKILSEYNLNSINVIIHCFSGNLNIMNQYLKMNCYISFAGNITYKNAHELRESLAGLNIDKLLTETDSPFLSPVPLRGKINNSLNVKIINEFIANFKNLDIDTLNEQLKFNFIKVFFPSQLNKNSQ